MKTSVGYCVVVFPVILFLYATATFISSKVSNTSNLVRATSDRPPTKTAYLALTPSNQPQRRGLPVVTPNSPPIERNFLPVLQMSFLPVIV